MTTLVVAGLLLTFNKQIEHFLIQQNQQSQLNNISKNSIKNANKKNGEFDFSKVKSIDLNQVARAKVGNKQDAIGLMAIPALKMNLPIMRGLSDYALSSGGGTMRPDQKMGEGNYPLAGHYMTNYGILFSPLENAQFGQKVYLTDLEYVYKYNINYKKKLPPKSGWIADNTKENMVTLLTCADGGSNRWVIRGSLVSVKKATNKNLKVFNLK